jgi:hypothetical protein
MSYFILESEIKRCVNRLRDEGFDFELWNTRRLIRYAYISYSDLRRMELKHLVPYTRRGENGRLVWTHKEMYSLLMKILYLKDRGVL